MATAKAKHRNISKGQPHFNPLWLWIGLGIIAVLAIGLFLWQNVASPANSLPPEISVATAFSKRTAGAFILDVRTPEEWAEYHIPEATLIPLDQLDTRLGEVPRDREVVVVCRSGNRSKQGRDILIQAGFKQVTSMTGGLKEWQAAGYPTVSGS